MELKHLPVAIIGVVCFPINGEWSDMDAAAGVLLAGSVLEFTSFSGIFF